ncbi:hypothetical protein [Cerasicoccus maritimus]|uniref:hypothetical protein n=1 Tax=Cerasicoccus maritimus TaxID=490089 RepID=UPI00285290F6|nr:hypothetical protein [Cerasicoccus maritimus]
MLRLFSTWFPCADKHRHDEFLEAVNRNLSCDAIDQLCILREGEAELPEHPKLVVREIQHRPLFNDFFAWINELQTEEDIAAIANTDIWLDETISLAHKHLTPQNAWALGRWDSWTQKPQLFDRNDSQDTWVFRGPLRHMNGGFPLGAPRCDNRILYEMQEAGYLVKNPAFSIICHHQHDEPPRAYLEVDSSFEAPPPYRYLYPENLMSYSEIRRHNAQSPIKLHWQIDPRKIQRTLPYRAWLRLTKIFR